MSDRPRILLLDDDQDLLDLYKEILAQLPSRPEICTSTSGARAIAMMEADRFNLLVCDLNMPKMDGLQVLSIVRRKFPEVRTVVLTSIIDEQFRSRAYGLGVDLYWQKPGSGEEIKQFLECIESLFGREAQGGFRGVQSKSLVDIIQLECLSQNSIVLKIINGPFAGRIWIQTGEVIDAVTDKLVGEEAFRRILSWRAGSFETLPAEANHPRTIYNSYQGLLLETAQAQDEADVLKASTNTAQREKSPSTPLAEMARFPGVEFVLVLKTGPEKKFEARGLENPQPVADWTCRTLEQFRSLGERLRAGPLHEFDGLGLQRHIALAPHDDRDFCVGWQHTLNARQIQESFKKLLTLWVS